MNSTSHDLYQKTLTENLDKWRKRKARALSENHLNAALLLFRLDLDPLRPLLRNLYSTSPRGRKPYDPVLMFRALLLMTLLQQDSIDTFAEDLRKTPRLATIAGFQPHKTPACGTFYLFLDRLENGPSQPACQHRVLPSDSRKGSHQRNLSKEKAAREASRKQILAECDSITDQLAEVTLAQKQQPRPHDLQMMLENILLQVAVKPSAARGLLGDLSAVILNGDGSSLYTGASPYGKAICQCRQQGVYKCDHDRLYQDATANWGWDSYHEVYYFGHKYYQHTVSTSGHDLPVHVTIGPASETDFTLSIKSLDRFLKACRENELRLTLYAMGYDAGHDAHGNYRFLLAHQIRPVIALNPRTGQHPKPTGTAERVNDNGVPLCLGNLEMRRHSQTPKFRIIYHCPVKRPTHVNGKHAWKAHVNECPLGTLCQSDTKMGPSVYVRSDEDPRFYPEIARDSAAYKKIMNLRSGCERSNSVKKVAHKLGNRVCRSATHFLIRLYLVSMVEHAKAWLAEDRKLAGNDEAKLADPKQIHIGAMAASR